MTEGDVSRESSPDRGGPALALMAALAAMGLPAAPPDAARLVAFVDRMLMEPQNLTAIEDVEEAIGRHLADSLSALVVRNVRDAGSLVDLGSGGGLPGIPLAMFLPDCAVTLVESEGRKASWLSREASQLPNVRVVAERSETLARDERERWDVAAARALAPLPVTLELAAPLVAPGGALVVWQGPRDGALEEQAALAAAELGFGPAEVTHVEPFPGADRHLHVFPKTRETPRRYPRRPGRARKRPIA